MTKATTSHVAIVVGTPRTFALASQITAGLVVEMALPPAISRSMPCRIVAVARVRINGWTRRKTMPSPFSAPTASAMESVRKTPTRPLSSHAGLTSGMMMVVKVMTPATERSIPAPITTSVWPAAAMPMIEASSTM